MPEGSGSKKRPLSEDSDQLPEIEEQSHHDPNRDKRLKVDPTQSTTNLDLFQRYHRELLNLLNRVPPPLGLRFRSEKYSAMPGESIAKNDLLPSLHVEDPNTHLIRKPHQEPFDILNRVPPSVSLPSRLRIQKFRNTVKNPTVKVQGHRKVVSATIAIGKNQFQSQKK
ncbi:hypothetical protein PGT21_006298 [Puccinia graminis f. sp. tritici]|nr:hypothetical protein PGT21_006298 [Puccinia graminis f. sp. tritici]